MAARRRHTTSAGNPLLDLPPVAPAAIEPVRETWPPGSQLLRVYSSQPYKTEPLTFREHGPHSRFDHQRPAPDGRARLDHGRGSLYAGADLACSLGEFFADSLGVINLGGTRVARIQTAEPLMLLDLRTTAALGVGTTQAIGGISQRKTTQAWARHLYEHPELIDIHGLLYTAANTGRDAAALFERADGKLTLAADFELGDPAIDHDLQLAAHTLKLAIVR